VRSFLQVVFDKNATKNFMINKMKEAATTISEYNMKQKNPKSYVHEKEE
jgi:hypothetical protein